LRGPEKSTVKSTMSDDLGGLVKRPGPGNLGDFQDKCHQQPTRIDRKAGQAIPPAALDPQIKVFHPFEGLDTFILACGKSLIVS
jgi:hypothetical protein